MDQANRLRGMIRDRTGDSPHRSGRIIAIASGKGGVGKSVIALNLATELARRGRRVVLIDADLGMGSVEILSGSTAEWNISHFVAGTKSFGDVLVKTPHGVSIVAGANGNTELTDTSTNDCTRLGGAVIDVRRRSDDVILDLSSGIGTHVRTLVAIADETIVVTSPEPTAIAGAYAFVKSLAESAENMSVLVNLAESAGLAQRISDRFKVTAAQFAGVTIRDTGYLPRDTAVVRSVQNREPFVISEPRSPAAKEVANVVNRLLQKNVVAEADFVESPAAISPIVAAA